MRRVSIALVLASLQIASPTAAQEVERLTRKDCIARALQNGDEIAEMAAEVELAMVRVDRAKAGRWPRVEYDQLLGIVNEARGDAVFSPNETTDFFSGLGPFTRIDFRIVQPLYTFGRLSAGIKAAESGLASAVAKRRRKLSAIAFAVEELYLNLLLNERLREEVQEIEESFAEALETARERLEEGAATVTQSDVLKLEYGLDEIRDQLVEIEKGERLSRAALARAIGRSPDEPFELAERALTRDTFELGTLQEYQQRAVASRPDLEELAYGIEAKAARVKEKRAELFPSFFLLGIVRYGVAPNRDDQLNPFVYDEFNYIDPGFVLGAHWEFSFEALEQVDEAEAELRQVRAQQRNAVSGIRLEVERAYRELEAARRRVEIAERQRRTARSLVVVSATAYELGVGDPGELMEAFGMFGRATGDLLLAVRDHNLAAATLRRASGVDPAGE